MEVDLDFGAIDESNWEAFLESFNKYIKKAETAASVLATIPPNQVENLVRKDAQLSANLEVEHQRIITTILANSELEYEATDETAVDAIPTLEIIQEKTKELKEELNPLKAELEETQGRNSKLKKEVEGIKQQVAAEEALAEKNRTQLEAAKKLYKDRAGKVCLKMAGCNPIAMLFTNNGNIEDMLFNTEKLKEHLDEKENKSQNTNAIVDKETFWQSLNEQFEIK